MMLDRILALLALIGLGLFVATVPIFVPDADLIILCRCDSPGALRGAHTCRIPARR
jgi:hypothetical protein